jgi:hypothetical protein
MLNANKKIILLTHYMPSFQLVVEKYRSDPLTCCFASDLDDLIKKPIRFWLCGHSHSSFSKVINDVTCALNCRGYVHELVEGFDGDRVIEV